MSDFETGGTECSDDEAHAVMSIMFAKGVADAVRALRAYCDKRVKEILAGTTTPSWGGEPEEKP